MTRAYSEAAVEVLDILDHTAIEKVKLIPTKFINYLKENAAKDYIAELDYSKPINEMNVKIETKGILGTICRNWWWNVEEKQEYARLVKENEFERQEELREKYNPDVFKGIREKKEQATNVIQQENAVYEKQMVEYKESIFSRIINRIRNIFRPNKELNMVQQVYTEDISQNKFKNNDFANSIRLDANAKHKILKTQRDLENNIIDESQLTEEQRRQLQDLYREQIAQLKTDITMQKNQLNDYKKQIVNARKNKK